MFDIANRPKKPYRRRRVVRLLREREAWPNLIRVKHQESHYRHNEEVTVPSPTRHIYQIIPKLIIQEVSCNMRRKQIEKNPLVGGLKCLHVQFFLSGLVLPQKIQSCHPFHLSSVQCHSEKED